jgi:hypothetical protein
MRESFAFNRLLNASVLAAERQHFSARAALAAIRRSRSRFQKSCLPNGGRKVVGGRSQIHSTPFRKTCKPENQIIVTRERTS